MTLRLTLLCPTLLCLTLAACSTLPVVDWPPASTGPAPVLQPLDALLPDTTSTAQAQGAALAAQAAALKVRAAAIGN